MALSSGGAPGGVYRSFDGDSSGSNEDVCPPSKDTMQVHGDPLITSGPGEMPARTRASPAEIRLLLKNVIEQAVFVKRNAENQEGQERLRLTFQKIQILQRSELYYQWCLQIHHCYCRFQREHPPAQVCGAAEMMEVDAVALEKALEQAFLKVAQEESRDLPITNTIESWQKGQEVVVRRPE